MNTASRSILITGAGSGLGRGLALCLAQQGHTIIATDCNTPTAVQTAVQIDHAAGKCESFGLDVTSEESIAAFQYAIGDRRVDVLINNAGLQHVAPVEEFPTARWDLLMDVMVRGTFLMTRAVLPGMRAAGFGRIINIGSIHALIASPFKSAYTSAKHALVGFAKAVALETAGTEITVNTICPAYIRTSLVESQIKDLALRTADFRRRGDPTGDAGADAEKDVHHL